MITDLVYTLQKRRNIMVKKASKNTQIKVVSGLKIDKKRKIFEAKLTDIVLGGLGATIGGGVSSPSSSSSTSFPDGEAAVLCFPG